MDEETGGKRAKMRKETKAWRKSGHIRNREEKKKEIGKK